MLLKILMGESGRKGGSRLHLAQSSEKSEGCRYGL